MTKKEERYKKRNLKEKYKRNPKRKQKQNCENNTRFVSIMKLLDDWCEKNDYENVTCEVRAWLKGSELRETRGSRLLGLLVTREAFFHEWVLNWNSVLMTKKMNATENEREN